MIPVDVNLLKINPRELKSRLLGADDTETHILATKCEAEVRAATNCFYTCRETAVKIDGDTVDFDLCTVKSQALATNLRDCNTAFVVSVSLGLEVDRLLKKTAVQSTLKHFVTDAVASALTEALCDYVQSLLPETKPRFSPGFGGVELSIQKPILEFLGHSGLTLTDSCLLIPSKSVTFIAGRKI